MQIFQIRYTGCRVGGNSAVQLTIFIGKAYILPFAIDVDWKTENG